MSSDTATAAIIYLGLDVHKDSVTFAVLPEGARGRLSNVPTVDQVRFILPSSAVNLG